MLTLAKHPECNFHSYPACLLSTSILAFCYTASQDTKCNDSIFGAFMLHWSSIKTGLEGNSFVGSAVNSSGQLACVCVARQLEAPASGGNRQMKVRYEFIKYYKTCLFSYIYFLIYNVEFNFLCKVYIASQMRKKSLLSVSKR